MCINKYSCMQINQEEFELAVAEEGIHGDYGSEYDAAQREVCTFTTTKSSHGSQIT